jgi:hypothetical protein
MLYAMGWLSAGLVIAVVAVILGVCLAIADEIFR